MIFGFSVAVDLQPSFMRKVYFQVVSGHLHAYIVDVSSWQTAQFKIMICGEN